MVGATTATRGIEARPVAPFEDPLAWLFVPVASLLGLARAMGDFGAGTFGDVWTANLWGDVVFVAGTLATCWAVRRVLAANVARAGRFVLAVVACLGLTLAAWIAAFTFTAENYFDGGSFVAFNPWLDLPEVADIVWTYGWMGAFAVAVAMPLAVSWQMRHAAKQDRDLASKPPVAVQVAATRPVPQPPATGTAGRGGVQRSPPLGRR